MNIGVDALAHKHQMRVPFNEELSLPSHLIHLGFGKFDSRLKAERWNVKHMRCNELIVQLMHSLMVFSDVGFFAEGINCTAIGSNEFSCVLPTGELSGLRRHVDRIENTIARVLRSNHQSNHHQRTELANAGNSICRCC